MTRISPKTLVSILAITIVVIGYPEVRSLSTFKEGKGFSDEFHALRLARAVGADEDGHITLHR